MTARDAGTLDYVVVGAGSAGAALANRLSANPSNSVVILEAGGPDTNQSIHIPAAFSGLFKSEFDWNYGTEGPNSVEHQRSPRELTATFLKAVTQAGYAVVPPNSRLPEGFSQTMISQKKGARHSTVDAYLTPAQTRTNLVVRTGAHVTPVLFDGTRAVGVEYRVGSELHQVRARGEVILSGGAVNTPQLLMLSGIGDAAQFTALGIPVIVNSPEVGANLRDHLVSFFTVETPGGTLLTASALKEVGNYLARRRGMLTSNVAEAYGFVRSDDDLDLPDLEIIYAPTAYVDEGLSGIPGHGISVGPILLQPKSTGRFSCVVSRMPNASWRHPRSRRSLPAPTFAR